MEHEMETESVQESHRMFKDLKLEVGYRVHKTRSDDN